MATLGAVVAIHTNKLKEQVLVHLSSPDIGFLLTPGSVGDTVDT